MNVAHLWLTDFRCYREVDLELGEGLTVFEGANAQGKTSLLEAVTWAATTKSFRGVPDSALVRDGSDRGVLRLEVTSGERTQLLEAEIRVAGRNRILVNHNPLARARELLGFLRVTVFAPDDLDLVKGSPAGRRDYLDDLLVSMAPRYEAARGDYEKVLRQRNALLRGAGPVDLPTLDVFDLQLVAAGAELVRGRLQLIDRLTPWIRSAYHDLASATPELETRYEAEWADGELDLADVGDVAGLLEAAVVRARPREIERRTTLVGPHRDEWRLRLRGLEARTHASQGEQRTYALALRLAGHHTSCEVVGEDPVLLLDDVFSELDADRAAALVKHLPSGQTLLTTAGVVPDGIEPERRLRVVEGSLVDVGP
ncbi:MAG: replication and repair protein RecF [Actinomycetia bacterium]|nr:replication and repair protein RecF [Actinomycetes bacterium]